jgi:hypothetical protein
LAEADPGSACQLAALGVGLAHRGSAGLREHRGLVVDAEGQVFYPDGIAGRPAGRVDDLADGRDVAHGRGDLVGHLVGGDPFPGLVVPRTDRHLAGLQVRVGDTLSVQVSIGDQVGLRESLVSG